jgi:hypothetical protein
LAIHQGKLFHAMGEYGNLIFSRVAASLLLNQSNVDAKSKIEIALPRHFMVDLRLKDWPELNAFDDVVKGKIQQRKNLQWLHTLFFEVY